MSICTESFEDLDPGRSPDSARLLAHNRYVDAAIYHPAAPFIHLSHIQTLTLDLEDGLSEVVNVAAGDARNRDTAVLGEVNRRVLGDLLNLLGLQASESEHADLGGDVGPVVLGAKSLELLTEELAHGDDAVGHALDLALPLGVELGVVEDLRGDAGTVDGGVGVHGADDDLELGVETLGLLGVLTDNGEDTGTLTVETLLHLLVI